MVILGGLIGVTGGPDSQICAATTYLSGIILYSADYIVKKLN